MNEAQIHLLIALLTAHFCGDFLLQTDRLVARKKQFQGVLLHSALVALISYLFVGDWRNWAVPGLVFITHLAIDEIKQILPWKGLAIFLADQVAHWVTLAMLAAWVIPVRLEDLAFVNIFGREISGVFILLSGWIVVSFFCSQIIGESLARFEVSGFQSRGLKDGGKWIGILERSIIFFLLIINAPGGIGFLITAKTIFRFGEIQIKENRKEVEYILIGTLLSFCLAIAGTWLTLMLAQPWLSLTFKAL